MMPSLRKKVAGFIRQLSVNNQAESVINEKNDSSGSGSGCFIQRYLSGRDVKHAEPLILHGRNPHELPPRHLGSFTCGPHTVFAALTGPDGGLTTVNRRQRHLSTSDPDVDYIDIADQRESSRSAGSEPLREEIAGVTNWFRPHSRAYGAATTLYEQNPMTKENAGNPIADCFGIVARYDSAILALADGVNWGEKACVAARSAIHGCIEYLNKAVFGSLPTVINSTEVFVALLRSFHAAHNLILQEQGMLTTLTVAVILPLAKSERFVVCVCNVGDSLAYVYSKKNGVREITKGSHDIHCMRDMRDALGALGPVDGQNPELNNLTCSMTEVEQGDIVFLTSDGISDNFDPVVGKFAVMPPLGEDDGPPLIPSSHCLPTVQAYQRHELSLLRMDDLLKHGVSGEGPPCDDARSLCELLLDFATRLTAAKRRILEDSDLYCTQDPVTGKLTELSRGEQRSRRKKACEKLAMMPGKLDHATVVAFKVEEYQESDNIPETAL